MANSRAPALVRIGFAVLAGCAPACGTGSSSGPNDSGTHGSVAGGSSGTVGASGAGGSSRAGGASSTAGGLGTGGSSDTGGSRGAAGGGGSPMDAPRMLADGGVIAALCQAPKGQTSENCGSPGAMYDSVCTQKCGIQAFVYLCENGLPPIDDCIYEGTSTDGSLTFCCMHAACVHTSNLDRSCDAGKHAVSCHTSATVDARCSALAGWTGVYCCPV